MALRRLATDDPESDYQSFVDAEVAAVERSLFTIQPMWCSFQGVTCGNFSGLSDYGRVLEIDLSQSSLIGSLPSSIGNFGNLTFFDIATNGIYGTIPGPPRERG